MASDRVEIDITAKDKTKKGVNSATNSLKSMAKTIGPLVALGFGVAAIKNATDAYIRQENAVAQLEQRLKSTGNAVGIASEELQGMAASLQSVTTFGDEAIIEMQSLLLTFTKIGGETFPQATEAILNVSTAMGQDLRSSAVQVGKALNDPIAGIGALSRSGIQFTETQKDMIKALTESGDLIGAQSIILKELETQFGGAARAARNTLGGALTSLANTFGDEVFEAFGKGGTGFIPLIQQLEEVLKSSEFRSGMSTMSEGFAAIGEALGVIGENVGKANELFDFLNSDAIMSAIPGANLLAIAAGFREIAAATSGPVNVPTAMPARPEGGFVSPAEQQAINAKMSSAVILSEIDQEVTDKELDQLISRLENQEAIWEVQRQQLQQQNDYKLQLIDEEEKANELAAQRKLDREQAAADAGMKALADLSSLMNSESKKAFEIGKIAAIASTTIDTYQSATSSFKALSGIPVVGPALGAAAAAAAIAAGLANVQAISSQQFQGGGGGTPAVPNISASTVGPTGPVGQPQGAPQPTFGDNIEVRTGSVLGVLIEEEIIPAMVEAQKRGVQLVIT
jgi:hypothetical protein